VERLRNIINRNQLRRHIAVWAENAWLIRCLEAGLWKATKRIERRRLRNTFERYLAKVKEAKREEYILGRVRWFASARAKRLQDVVTDAWKAYVRRFKSARTFLLRSIKGVDRLIANESFTVWKTVYFTARREVYHANIAELQRRKRGHEQHIGELNRQIQINDSTQHHIESKLQSQSQKILANFIARFIHSAQARGFYTWLDELKEFKTRRRHLRSTVAYWIKQNSGRAFRTWAETVLALKERDLQTELA